MSHLLSILVCLAAATVTCFTLPTFFKTESIVTSRSKPYQRDHHILFQAVKANSVSPSLDRFEQFANSTPDAGAPCVLTIEGSRYNLTAWAKSHPGGERILAKFNEKDATKSFRAAHHSMAAYEMLQDFAIDDSLQPPTYSLYSIPRWRAKLFTKEDRIGVHKYLGIFCLLNFIFRFYQMLLGDPSAGLGTRVGKGPSAFPVLFLVPHGMLSVSALIFPHIPRERVVGKPMIWQEYRIHNLIFGVRSVICALFCALSFRYPTNLGVRRLSISGSCLSVLAANIGADLATKKLQPHETGSTTATMPYWEGCSVKTQKKFKQFYAYSQFLATLSCVAVINPAWPLSVLLAIQIASLLMTLVRKGLLSAKGYHMGYTASLIAPYFVGIRSMLYMKNLQFPIMLAFGYVLFQARRRGLNKYLLWVPVIVARIAIGDRLLDWSSWAVH